MASDSSVGFGSLLDRFLRREQMSQADLAREISYSYSLITKIKAGVRRPTDGFLTAVVTALGLSSSDARTLHDAALDASGDPEDPASSARQLLASGNAVAGAVWLIRAAEVAFRGYDLPLAESLAREALAVRSRAGRSDTERLALAALGRILAASGGDRGPEALEVLRRSASLHRQAGDMDGYWRATAAVALVHREAGRLDDAIGTVEVALPRSLPVTASIGLVELYNTLARIRYSQRRPGDSAAAARTALELADMLDGTTAYLAARAEATLRLGQAALLARDYAKARVVLAQAVEMSRLADDDRTLAQALYSQAEVQNGRMERARRLALESRELDVGLGLFSDVGWDDYFLGTLAFWLGDWQEATVRFTDSLENRGSEDRPRSLAQLFLAVIAYFQASSKEYRVDASSQIDAMLRRAREEGNGQLADAASFWVGVTDAVDGRHERVDLEFDGGGEILSPSGQPSSILGLMFASLRNCELGAVGPAIRESALALALCRNMDDWQLPRVAVTVRVFVLLRADRVNAATFRARQALAYARTLDIPLLNGFMYLESAKAMARTGDVNEARRCLRLAKTCFDRLESPVCSALAERTRAVEVPHGTTTHRYRPSPREA